MTKSDVCRFEPGTETQSHISSCVYMRFVHQAIEHRNGQVQEPNSELMRLHPLPMLTTTLGVLTWSGLASVWCSRCQKLHQKLPVT